MGLISKNLIEINNAINDEGNTSFSRFGQSPYPRCGSSSAACKEKAGQ